MPVLPNLDAPLSLAENTASRLAVLNTPDGNEAPTYQISADGTHWTAVEAPEKEGSMTILQIPVACLESATVHVRLERCAVSGFALLA